MLPWPHTFDHLTPNYSYDAAGGTIVGFTAVATGIPCQVDSTGGSLAADRTTGDGMTQRARLITSYGGITNGSIVAIQSGSEAYYRVVGGDQPMLATSGVIPTTYYWDVERWRATS